jgi:hypothetical protein
MAGCLPRIRLKVGEESCLAPGRLTAEISWLLFARFSVAFGAIMNKNCFKKRLVPLILAPAAMIPVCVGQVTQSPPNYTITTPSAQYSYNVNNQSSGQPAQNANVDDSLNFSLPAGATYVFSINTAAIHPVDICTYPDDISYYSGASAQTVNSGTVTVTIPSVNYPPTLYYVCDIHLFYGTITITPPVPPPPTAILNVNLSSNNVALTFTGGTNTSQVIPQYSSNLTTWLPVSSTPGYTNTWGTNADGSFSGTNISLFGREPLDAICGPNVFLRVSQLSP